MSLLEQKTQLKKHRLDLGISIEKTYGFKSMDDSINLFDHSIFLIT
jgi:hypothetical protein